MPANVPVPLIVIDLVMVMAPNRPGRGPRFPAAAVLEMARQSLAGSGAAAGIRIIAHPGPGASGWANAPVEKPMTGRRRRGSGSFESIHRVHRY